MASKPNIVRWREAVLSESGPQRPPERLVALALANFSGSTGGAVWPSQETIAANTGLGLRTVRRATEALEEQHWIERAESQGSGQSWRRYVYRLKLPEGAATESARVAGGAARVAGKVRPEWPHVSEKVRPESPKGAARVADEQEIEQETSKHIAPDGAESLPLLDEIPRKKDTPSKNGTHTGPDAAQVRTVFATVDGKRLEALRDRGTPARNLQATKARLGHIRARLREGYAPDELERAAEAFLRSDWHLRRGFSDPFEYALRDDAKLQRWLAEAERSHPRRPGPFIDEVDVIEAAARAEPISNYAAGAST